MDTFKAFITPELLDMIGIMGFGLYVINYALLTLDKLRSEHLAYFMINWMAASMVLVGLASSFNLASALIQVFWIGISTVGIIIRLRGRPRPAPAPFRSRRAA